PHPAEWLKRTLGNDWVYYFSGGYTNVYDCLGEYYVPCFPYPSNSLWTRDPFQDPEVQDGLQAWPQLRNKIARGLKNRPLPREVKGFLGQVAAKDPSALWAKALRLFALLQGRVSVLPPDSRHVDYDILPLHIADGCLYNCGFCSVKSRQGFEERSRDNIQGQIAGLQELVGQDIINYNAVFLGQHDALHCRPELIEDAALSAYTGLGLHESLLQNRYLFLFGSVDSLLQAGDTLWARLQELPYHVYINIGLESGHQPTLDAIRKPIDTCRVFEAYDRMLEINKNMSNIEITANMLMDLDMHPGHWQSLQEMIQDRPGQMLTKGAVYLSAMSRQSAKDQIRMFQGLKRRSKIPLYLYLLQRL
ncbi:MAG: radical SAM protein, partial [Desulfovermiculus sp.]